MVLINQSINPHLEKLRAINTLECSLDRDAGPTTYSLPLTEERLEKRALFTGAFPRVPKLTKSMAF